MPARRNRHSDPFTRGLVLGRMYEQRRDITVARVRRLFDVSLATAKRDVAAMRRQGAKLPRKPAAAMPVPAMLTLRKAA